MVPAREICRWLGLEPGGLDHLAAGGMAPQVEGSDALLDPLHVQDWLHSQSRRPATGSVPNLVAALREAALALAIRQPLEAAFRRILSRLADGLGATAAAIFLNEAGSGLRRIASAGDVQAGGGGEALEGIASWVAASGEPLLLTDPRRIGDAPPGSRAEAVRDVLAFPIAPEGRLACVLVVIGDLSADTFAQRGLALASAAAELALVVVREETQRALEDQIDASKHAQLQLEAFALDIRRTFAAEKQRAEELAAALAELQQTYLATVHGLAVAVEAKDEMTAGHIVRVTHYALAMLRLILPEEVSDPEYEYGFLLHDIGKLSVPDAILGKRGPLTDDEWVVMKLHPESGRRILEGIPFLQRAKQIVYAHHERWDGKGYPLGLRGEEVPVAARLFPVADSYDAMTSDRPYRRAMPVDAAHVELRHGSGSQFWPDAVEAFLSVPMDELEAIRCGPSEWKPRGLD